MEDLLQWKITLEERGSLIEEATFDGRQPLIEDTHSWKTTFHQKIPLMDDSI